MTQYYNFSTNLKHCLQVLVILNQILLCFSWFALSSVHASTTIYAYGSLLWGFTSLSILLKLIISSECVQYFFEFHKIPSLLKYMMHTLVCPKISLYVHTLSLFKVYNYLMNEFDIFIECHIFIISSSMRYTYTQPGM